MSKKTIQNRLTFRQKTQLPNPVTFISAQGTDPHRGSIWLTVENSRSSFNLGKNTLLLRHSPIDGWSEKLYRNQCLPCSCIRPTIQPLLLTRRGAECTALYVVSTTGHTYRLIYIIQSDIVNIVPEWVQNSRISVSYNCFHRDAHLNLLRLTSLANYRKQSNVSNMWLRLLIGTPNKPAQYQQQTYRRITSSVSFSTIV